MRQESDWSDVTMSLRQGSVMSQCVFNIFMDRVRSGQREISCLSAKLWGRKIGHE